MTDSEKIARLCELQAYLIHAQDAVDSVIVLLGDRTPMGRAVNQGDHAHLREMMFRAGQCLRAYDERLTAE
jgi:hypothetical protein